MTDISVSARVSGQVLLSLVLRHFIVQRDDTDRMADISNREELPIPEFSHRGLVHASGSVSKADTDESRHRPRHGHVSNDIRNACAQVSLCT